MCIQHVITQELRGGKNSSGRLHYRVCRSIDTLFGFPSEVNYPSAGRSYNCNEILRPAKARRDTPARIVRDPVVPARRRLINHDRLYF